MAADSILSGWDGCKRVGLLPVAALLLAASPASAQFVCTTTPTDITCSNSGTAAGFTNSGATGANQNATTINSGSTVDALTATFGGGNATTVNSAMARDLEAITNNGGDATATNSGTARGVSALTQHGGNATATNSATISNALQAETSNGGAATSINSGTVSGFGVVSDTLLGGNAIVINSGTVNGRFLAQTFHGGDALATNSGTISGVDGLVAETDHGGNAVATNSGTVSSGIIATATGGNATATNSGMVNSGINVTANGGDATATNYGTVKFDIVTAAGGGNSITVNSGTVGGEIRALASGGGNATASNSGAIQRNLGAVTLDGGNATVTNSGIVGSITSALTGNGGNATATNSGTVNGALQTITDNGGTATTINSGTVNGGVFAVTVHGDNAIASNSGTVNGLIRALSVSGGNATVINSGMVNGNVNLSAVNGTSTFINSGTASNFGGNAISFGTGQDTLTLLPRSFIVGDILLAGSNDTVNVRTGNLNLTFNSLAAATVTGTVPFAVSGNRVASVDPTPFALADKNLMDFTGGISSILGSLGDTTAVTSGPSRLGFAPESGANRIGDAFASLSAFADTSRDRMVFKNPTMVYDDGRSVWARGFAGERFQQADDANLRAHNLFEGGAVGADLVARSDLKLGIFAGGGHSELSLDLNAGGGRTDTVFGGVYGRYLFSSFGHASFFDFALHGGGSNNSTSRNINNNLLATGLETATASYNGSYVSPELTYGVKLPVWADTTLTPSLKLRYVAGTFGGYTEAGSTANLTVASRTISDFEQRGELKLTHITAFTPKDALLTSVHAGVVGLERLGDTTINTVLLGQGLPFATPGKNTVAGAFAGLGMEWRTRSGVSFFGAAEYIATSDQATLVTGRGGIKVAF